MTESAYSSIHGAEISERSTELVLPSGPAASLRGEARGEARGELDDSGAGPSDSAASAWQTSPLATAPENSDFPGLEGATPTPSDPAASRSGFPLPGDRGPRDFEGGSQRPSFWRRIALGRRAQSLRTASLEHTAESQQTAAFSPAREADAIPLADAELAIPEALAARRALSTRESRESRESSAIAVRSSQAAERRIVEPLLQALVSVEAKLERSHVDLIGRSDQVEQRLTQLWDIEEQLGALGELQESVLQVTEQQRRLEAALVAQTRILRWLVGGIILSLAVAAFSVAFFLRVSG